MSAATAKRKLTTILAADVVGYSQMMAADEEATLATLQTYRMVTDGLVDKHNGRVFSTAGDAFLADFASAVEAVRCAISIQEDLAVRNAELPEHEQMWFRIGVNVGDVMIDKQDLFGDGVNVAARLEGLADKGGICISGSTFDQVKNKLTISFDDIGAQKVKNIPEPIPAFRIVPGKVTVSEQARTEAAAKPKGGAGRKLAVSALAAAALVLAALYFAGVLPRAGFAAHPFDGEWRVTVGSLTGCLDNSQRSFSITIQGGRIDEQQHQLPKTGLVSTEGDFSIKVTDRAGNIRNTQTGRITGDVGEGGFRGRKDGCAGAVKIVRLE